MAPRVAKSKSNKTDSLSAMRRLRDALPECVAVFGKQKSTLIAAAACAASSGIMPSDLKNSALDLLANRVRSRLGFAQIEYGKSKFANTATCLLMSGTSDAAGEKFAARVGDNVEQLEQLLFESFEQIDWSDPRCVAWFYQSLTSAEQLELRGRATVETHRQRPGCEELYSLTQWFTPDWIVDFMVSELRETWLACESEPTFLDPACGGGHVLVNIAKKLAEFASDATRAEKALGKQLFGLEIDPFVSKLAAFTLYLGLDKSLRFEDLPLPHVYTFEESGQTSFVGSLLLRQSSQNDNFTETVMLRRFDDQLYQPQQILPPRFTAVAMNPPYLSNRLIPYQVAEHLDIHFPNSKYDLYAAFLELATELLEPEGRLSAICQQSYLNITRYENLRRTIAETCSLRSLISIGSGAFSDKSGEKVNNVIITYDKATGSDSKISTRNVSSRTDRATAIEHGIHSLPEKIGHADRHRIAAADPFFDKLFRSTLPLQDTSSGVICTNGLFTCNNKHFVKNKFDVLESEKHLYVPYDKGGNYKWFRTTPLALRWVDDGAEIKKYRKDRGQSTSLPGFQYYFQKGVTYSYIGTKGFTARLLSPASIFDIASSSLFSQSYSPEYLVGFLNSALVRYLLWTLNPTINFQIGDLRRLPFIAPNLDTLQTIESAASQAVSLAQRLELVDPTSSEFQLGDLSMEFNPSGELVSTPFLERYKKAADEIEGEEKQLQKKIDECVFEHYKVPKQARTLALEAQSVTTGSQGVIKQISPKRFKESLKQHVERKRIKFSAT